MASLRRRGKSFQIQYYSGGKQTRISLGAVPYQIAKAKLAEFENGRLKGIDNPLPSRTPVAEVLEAYVQHIRATKTAKSAQTDVYYLREAFGPCCRALKVTSRTPSVMTRKRKPTISQVDGRRRMPIIEAPNFEAITPAQIGAFIDFKVRDQGLKPKTANHYRSIIRRVINWARQEYGLRLPNNVNPASSVRPYKESAPQIRHLTLAQIDEQLDALRFKPQLQTMVAVLIYAGLRREELLWLTTDDLDLSRRATGSGVIRVRAKTINGQSWQPKTRINRAVPVSRQLREYLDRYVVPASNAEWFFPSPRGSWWDPDNFSADLRQTNVEAGLVWTCLDYRHTFGSLLAQKGVSLYKVSVLMGNSPEICRRHYAALVPETMAEEVEFCRSSSFDTLRMA